MAKVIQTNLSFRTRFKYEILKQKCERQLDFKKSQSKSDTVARTETKRKETSGLASCSCFFREPDMLRRIDFIY